MARRDAGGGPGPRIVAGELGGRRLRAPRGAELRPSAERTREAIFSMLGPIEGALALDLYCGTGALGIEALSRGAASCVFVDTRIETARENVEALALGGRAELVRSEALAYLRRASGRFDLVLCDPPYRLARGLGPELDKLLPPLLAEGGRVITESPQDAPLELGLELLRERRYGAALVRIHAAPAGAR